jgi:hypothetical protein
MDICGENGEKSSGDASAPPGAGVDAFFALLVGEPVEPREAAAG